MSNRTKADIRKLIQYSESVDAKVSEDSREALRSLIDQGEAVRHLVQYYSKTQSAIVLDLLCRVKEPYDTELCNYIQEFMDGNVLGTIVLLGQIVQKAPSWLSKLIDHSLFGSLLKHMNSPNNAVVVVAGLLFISSLLPYCSALKKPTLHELFSILLSSSSFLYKRKKASDKFKSDYSHQIEAVYVSHLYSAITQYFVLLYGIYPTNLLNFLRENYLKSRERRAFTILEPVMCCVKFHPQLFKMNADQEMDRNRWSQREAHDFVADCRHVLVRPTVVPLSLQSKQTHLSPSRSAKSSSIMHPVDYHRTSESSLFSSSTHSICSSSNTKSDMDVDVWSPSISLGIETPPETKCATPLVHRPNTISNSTILPGSVSSRRSTAASDELRQRPSARHSSFGQKFTDIFRGRSRASEMKERCNDAYDQDEQRDRHSALSIEKILAETKEEDSEENIEVINAKAEITRRDSEASQVEEALDATDICLSPSSTLSYRTSTDRASTTITPTILSGSKRMLACDADEFDNDKKSVLNSDPLNDTSSTVHVENDLDSGELMRGLSDEKGIRSYCCADEERYEGDGRNGHANGMREDEDQREVNDGNDVFLTERRLSTEKNNKRKVTTTADEQRFSVSSFFRFVNRQRFTSECPPPMLITDLIHSRQPPRSNQRFTIHRVSSCPDLCEYQKSIHNRINTSAIQNKSTPKPSSLTASQINSAIQKDFPYLAFLRSVPFGNIDEEGIDRELSEEHEKTRRGYMEACIEHHSCLKQLGLADRLPAKIYDNMAAFLHGLSFEKQRDILSTRLSLVNQHLLYERCGRLLHAERNRRLFGRIKQQKLSDAEKISLQKSLHNALLEREQLVSALTEFRKRSMAERKKRDEIENAYREQLLRCQHECDKYMRELDKLDQRVARLTEVNEQLQLDLDTVRRRCENAEVELSLAQSKITELQQIKPQLQNAFALNQQLKDKITQCETYAKAVNTARAIELSTLSERSDQQLLAQISQLKVELKKERNARDASKMKTIEIEDEWKQERQRVNDLKVMLERAATLHIQQSEAAQHKFLSLLSVCQKQQAHINDLNIHIENLLYNRKSASSYEANPMPIPKSSVPDEILSYDSSVCGSDNTPFFPPELFAKHSMCSVPVETSISTKNSSVNRNTSSINHSDCSVIPASACKDSFDRVDTHLQSGTL